MKKKIQILGMKLDNYSVRESILLAESYLNGTSLNAIEDISMKMLMESENNEVLGQALQELDEQKKPYKILFLDAPDEVLMRRYSG